MLRRIIRRKRERKHARTHELLPQIQRWSATAAEMPLREEEDPQRRQNDPAERHRAGDTLRRTSGS